MKKLLSVIAIAMAFAFTAFAGNYPIVNEEEISEVITNYYPNLSDYYGQGVIKVDALTEDTLADGSTEYNIKYHFVRYQYTGEEFTNVLKEKYYDLYRLSQHGLVKDIVIMKYVNKDTGEIEDHIYYTMVWRPRQRFHR